jgi:uncharacterized glyoxalase superfamily protein PhnB
MLTNRSVPAEVVLPHIVYRDVARAMIWLADAFGFAEHYRYGDGPDGIQAYRGNAWIMLERRKTDSPKPRKWRQLTQYLTIFVDDIDEHYARSRAAGAMIVEELDETIYGERQYVALDLDGHRWLFSKHAKDVRPQDWGATVG